MPTISGITGAVTHGQSITITGTGFGTKTVAAPLVWDDASGPDDVRNIWTDARPGHITEFQGRNTKRRIPNVGVAPPHGRVGRYIAGCHYLNPGEVYGPTKTEVIIWKHLTASLPMDIYASCWHRNDTAWTFGGDNNLKNFQWKITNSIGGLSNINSLIWTYNPPPVNLDSTFKGYYVYNPEGDLSIFDTNAQAYPAGQKQFVGTADVHNPMTGWAKYEIVMRAGTAAQGGFYRLYENARLVASFTGHVDSDLATHRLFGFGGYARMYQTGGVATNWRYYTDLYLDTSIQRVILGNAPTLNASCTIREVQIPTAWSDASVSVDVNRGVFLDDDPVYVFVVDSSDIASAGFLVEPAPQSEPPVITSSLSVFATEGSSDPYQIVASNSPTSFTAVPLPGGRALNPSTGDITGTYSGVGFTQTVVTATNAFGTDQETVTFDVSQDAVAGIEDPVNIGTASNKSDTTLSVTSQTLVPTGNTIFVLVSCRGGTISTGIPICSDNVSFAQYVRDVYETNADGSRKAAIFRYSNNVELPVGSVITVSIDGGVGDAKAMTAFWVRGLDLIAPVDVFSSAVSEISTTTPNSGQITTT